jgi:hypothetical protein
VTGWWFSPGTQVSTTNKTDQHDIDEILLKVALNTLHYHFWTKVKVGFSRMILVTENQ